MPVLSQINESTGCVFCKDFDDKNVERLAKYWYFISNHHQLSSLESDRNPTQLKRTGFS